VRSGDHLALGVDGWKKGWVGVWLDKQGFVAARTAAKITRLIEAGPDARAIGVDIPIGWPATGNRACDDAARKAVGQRWPSVFMTPPRKALEASSFTAAVAVCNRLNVQVLSLQAYSLAAKIFEVEAVARVDRRVVEVHPEVSFAAMMGEPLQYPKKSWAGMRQRLNLLAAAGIELPNDLPDAGEVPPVDVIDAAAAAWSARRYLGSEANALGSPQFDSTGRRVTIWF